MKKKAVYLIGAGPMAIRTLIWAKEENLTTIVTDINPNAPGIKYADFWKKISASDKSKAHIKFAKELLKSLEICGVYCGNEIGSFNANQLRKFLDIPYVDENAMHTVLNKTEMKIAWQNSNISTPFSRVIKDEIHLENIIKKEKLKFIVKPALGSGSRGVNIIDNSNNALEIWKSALSSVENKGDILVEEFIEGRSIDVNGIFIKNSYYPSGILEKYITRAPNCLPLGGNDPVDLNIETIKKIHTLMEDACRKINLTEGPVKGDLILSVDNDPYILEVAPRLHGDVTTCNTLPFGSGCNPLKFMFRYYSTGKIDETLLNLKDKKGYAAWRVLCLPPGIEYFKFNESLLKPNKNISMIWFNKRHNKNLKSYSNTREIPGYIAAYGKDKFEVEDNMSSFCRKISNGSQKYSKSSWYKQLGDRLIEIGINPQSSGYM